MPAKITEVNRLVLKYIENLVLVVITIATIFACVGEVVSMFQRMSVHLSDLLLLFLYLEVLAMVGHYYESRKIPVRYPIYIGIMALARYLILDMKEMDDLRMITVVGAMLLLAVTALALRYGHVRFPYVSHLRKDEDGV